MSRIKPQEITLPAQQQLWFIKPLGVSLAMAVAVFPFILSLYGWAMSPRPSAPVLHSPSATQYPPAVAQPSQGPCPGNPVEVSLTATWRTLNPGNRCRIVHNFPAGTIEFRDKAGVFAGGGMQNRNPSMARAIRGEVRGYYSLCPLGSGNRSINWDCTYL